MNKPNMKIPNKNHIIIVLYGKNIIFHVAHEIEEIICSSFGTFLKSSKCHVLDSNIRYIFKGTQEECEAKLKSL